MVKSINKPSLVSHERSKQDLEQRTRFLQAITVSTIDDIEQDRQSSPSESGTQGTEAYNPFSISLDGREIELQKQQRLLSAASRYGFDSLDQLEELAITASVVGRNKFLSRYPLLRRDLNLWRILLEHLELAHGDDGIWKGWQLIKALRVLRAAKVDDPHAAKLLELLFNAGKRNTELLHDVCSDLIRIGFNYQVLYVKAVSSLMGAADSTLVTAICHKLRLVYRPERADILTIFRAACQAESSMRPLKHFCAVYNWAPLLHVYGSIVPVLCQQGRLEDAFAMHDFLLIRGDYPSNFDDVGPLVKHLAGQGHDPGSFIRNLEDVGIFYGGQIRKFYGNEKTKVTGYSADSLNIVNSASLGVEPRHLGDDFVARAFATTAVSVNFVLSALRLVGLAKLGPLAVRQVGLRAGNTAELVAIFKHLKELEVDTDSSVFTRLMRRIAARGHEHLLKQILETDLHHEVFEDFSVQKRLLEIFYVQRDWLKIDRTLAIMSVQDPQMDMDGHCANILLQRAVKARDFAGILNILNIMRGKNQKVRMGSINILQIHLLPYSSGRRPDVLAIGLQQLKFLIGICQQLLGSGHHIPLYYWRPVLVDLGRLGQLQELSALAVWLAKWYHPRGTSRSYLNAPIFGNDTDFSLLFDKRLQRALLEWGFFQQNSPRDLELSTILQQERQRWWTGLSLIRKLHRLVGLEVHTSTLRRAFEHRLRILFRAGHGMSALQRNQRIPRPNHKSMSHYLNTFEELLSQSELGQATVPPSASRIFGQAPRSIKLRTRRYLKRMRKRLSLGVDPWPHPMAGATHKPLNEAQKELQQHVATPTQSVHTERKEEEYQEDAVMYTDLYTPSWKEYKPYA